MTSGDLWSGESASPGGASDVVLSSGFAPRQRARGRRRGGDTVEVTVRLSRVQLILWLVSGSLISLNFLVALTGGLQLLPFTVTRFLDGNDRDSFLSGTRTTFVLFIVLLAFGCALAARRRQDPSARGWQLLGYAAGFAFLDENTSLRHSLAEVLRDRYHFTGPGGYAWTLLYLPAAVAVLTALVRDLRRITPAVRHRLLPGLAGFVIGAMALEPVMASIAEAHGDGSLSFKIAAAVSDSTELVGLTLLVSALLIAAGELAGAFTFRLAESGSMRQSLLEPAVPTSAFASETWPDEGQQP